MSWTESEFLKEISSHSPNTVSFYKKFEESKKTRFLILSGGNSGSVWLGNNLSLHSDIICSAGSDHAFGATSYGHNRPYLEDFCRNKIKNESDFFEFFKNGIKPSSSPYFPMPDLKNDKKWVLNAHDFSSISANLLGLDVTKIKDRNYYCPEHLIHEELEKIYPSKNTLGNIHAYMPYNGFFDRTKNYFLDDNIIIMTLIGDPIKRLSVIIKRYCASYRAFSNESLSAAINREDEDYKLVNQKFGTDPTSLEEVSFFLAIKQNILQFLTNEIIFNIAPIIKFEALKNDRSYFQQLVNYVSGGRANAHEDLLKSIYDNEDNLNGGRYTDTKNPDSSLDYWNDLKDWQKFLLAKKMDEMNFVELFKPYGYDLSFCKLE